MLSGELLILGVDGDQRGLSGSGSWCQQIVFDRKEGCASARGDTELLVDMLDVAVNRFGRDRELLGHLLDGLTTRDQAQYVQLTLGKLGWARWSWLLDCLPGGGQYIAHRVGV